MATREDRYATSLKPPPPPVPNPPPAPAPASTASSPQVQSTDEDMQTHTPAPQPLHLKEVCFSGFSPNDVGSSLHRRWEGSFLTERSDGETFSVDVVFIQTDSPHTTGPMVQAALEKLMQYKQCGCVPSKKVTCERHKDEREEGN